MSRAHQSYPSDTRTRNLRAAGIGVLILAICIAFLAGVYPREAGAQTAPSLGGATSFAVLAGSTVTNTDTSTIVYGNLGVSPGTAVTGFPPGVVNGVIHSNTAVAQDAQVGVTAAYGVLDQPCTQDLTGQNLGNRTLTPGVYCYDTSAGMTGTLTLDGEGTANPVFIFKIGSTLTTASASSVSLINGANACNVFWRVGASATLGTTTNFRGNILAQASITLNTGATIIGRALARSGAVTMDSNVVDARTCGAQAPTATPAITTPTATLPPATATAAAIATSTAIAATATAITESTSTPTSDGTGTPTGDSTSTPTGDGTSTPTGDGTSTPTGDGTGTPTGDGTSTPTGDGTSTPTGDGTSTPTGDGTSTPTGDGTGTPTGDSTGTPTSESTGTPSTARTSTPTLSAPGAPGTGTGPGGGGATSMSLLAVGAVLLLMGGSAAAALSARRRA